MEMLNFSVLLGADMWTKLIDVFAKWLVNYGWTIVVFTVALKLVLLPIDVIQRVSTQKQSKVMSAMQPEIDAIKEKYGNDKEKVNQETSKLYQKYKVNVGGMCLTMFLTLAVSLTVFFTLFSSIRKYGDEKLVTTYSEIQQVYETKLAESGDADLALTEATDRYAELKDQNSWLWVKNVWKSDKPESQFVDIDTYLKSINVDGLSDEEKTAKLDVAKNNYQIITAKIAEDEGDKNGNYVLIIITALVALGTQFLSAKVLAPKGQKLNGMNIMMMVMIPISMVLFTLSSNAVFALYTITNSLMTALTSTVLSIIFKNKHKGETPKEILNKYKTVEVVEYSRNYKK